MSGFKQELKYKTQDTMAQDEALLEMSCPAREG